MHTKTNFTKKQKIIAIAVNAVVISFVVLTPAAQANRYEERIRSLRQQNNSAGAAKEKLETSAETLESKIANLQESIAELETHVRDNQHKREGLKQEISKAEAEILRQRQLLGSNIKQMYLDSEFSTIEKLASSKTLGDYVDKEQYRISLQNKVKASLDNINQLKTQQEEQKVLIEKMLSDQEAMRAHQSSEKAEVGRLLSLNKTEQTQHSKKIAVNSSKITELQRQQAEANARFLREQAAQAEAARQAEMRRQAEATARRAREGSNSSVSSENNTDNNHTSSDVLGSSTVKYVNGRNYPWAYAPFPNAMVDPWGMYKRQCVSYTAWKVAASGRHMPYWGGFGNANQWPGNARRAGIPVDGKPRVGDVAVSMLGFYGHVMYVDAVHGDGTITISQYNAAWDGRYSEARIYPGGLQFIHF
ncbi:hypothetical protein BH23PAT1_BH23PAT1_0170 [soil metagenome]